jgi:hypothetical protein
MAEYASLWEGSTSLGREAIGVRFDDLSRLLDVYESAIAVYENTDELQQSNSPTVDRFLAVLERQ